MTLWEKFVEWLKQFFAQLPTEPKVEPEIPWLKVALKEKGTAEVPGPKDNPRIREYHGSVDLIAGDDTAWCASFVSWCLEHAGYKSANSARARDYVRYGLPMDKPTKGCIVIFWRGAPDAATGHVGFYMGEKPDSILVLGGNQSNQVCEAFYPKHRVLAYRWPVK